MLKPEENVKELTYGTAIEIANVAPNFGQTSYAYPW